MVTDFYNALKERGMHQILRRVEYKPQLFLNYEKMRSFFHNLTVHPNAKILIYGDYDVDGLMFTLETCRFLEALGCTNYIVFPYWRRTHELDKEAIRYCIQNHFEYFIVGDTASSDMDAFKELERYRVQVAVIDHHMCDYSYEDYPANVSIINSQTENKILHENKYAYSAAALAYAIYDYYAYENNIMYDKSISTYALVSLYSDCMDMSNDLNRAIYYRACSIQREDLPSYILHFLNEYQSFNARFIGFWYAPRINALFRGENFELLNEYFFDNSLDVVAKAKCIERINEHYLANRELTKQLVDLIDVTEYDNFVVADLKSSIDKNPALNKKAHNYTGLVANKLSERYGKTAIVYCLYNNYYKGSLRDLHSKDYLSIFKHLCYAAGHNAAFGIKINLLELQDFINKIERIDARYSITSIPNEPIIVMHEYVSPDSTLVEDIALYNEFSGNAIPVVYIYKRLIGAMPETKNAYYYRYDWGDYFVQSDHQIELGTKMLIKPIKSGRTKLLYQN